MFSIISDLKLIELVRYKLSRSLLLVGIVLFSQVSDADTRSWKSQDGVKINADYISANDDSVTIKRVKDGRVFTIPLDRLSEEDREWVKKQGVIADSEEEGVAENPEFEIIELPLLVYLIKDIEMEKKGVEMDPWITSGEFTDTVLPEINRIWKQAGIVWTLKEFTEQPAGKVKDKEDAIVYIQNAKRDEHGKSDSARTPLIKGFCDVEAGHRTINNLYLFPYTGETSQGFASLGGNKATVGLWTDKPSGGKRPPQKVKLVEEEPFKIGSLARTCAHELGHNLGLIHPDKSKQIHFNRLMGGKKHGYELIPEEIETAREMALKRRKLVR